MFDEVQALAALAGEAVGVPMTFPRLGRRMQEAEVIRIAAAENRAAAGFLASSGLVVIGAVPTLVVDRSERLGTDRAGSLVHAEAHTETVRKHPVLHYLPYYQLVLSIRSRLRATFLAFLARAKNTRPPCLIFLEYYKKMNLSRRSLTNFDNMLKCSAG